MPEISKCEHQTNFFFVHNKNLLFLSISFFYLNEFLFCFLFVHCYFPPAAAFHISHVFAFLFSFLSSMLRFIVQAMMSTGNVKVRVMPLLFDIDVYVCVSIQKKKKKTVRRENELHDVVCIIERKQENEEYLFSALFALAFAANTETNEIRFFTSHFLPFTCTSLT